jgi:hypothetical protein
MITLTCHCGQTILLESDELGAAVECPACGEIWETPEAAYLPEAKRVCPMCGSRQWRKIASRRAFKKKVPGASTWKSDDAEELNTAFTFTLPRECQECGAIWVAPAPAWGVIFLMLIGAWMALGAAALWLDFLPDDGRAKLDSRILFTGMAAGLAIFGYGVHWLLGEKGQATLLKIGTAENSEDGREYQPP